MLTQEEMRILVPEKLREIERDYHVEVLWAVESGSRAWGFAAAWTPLLAVCISGCIRQFRKQPVTRSPLPPGTWKYLLWGGVVLLGILILSASRVAPGYIAAYAAQEDSAAGYASLFFPLVIGAELVSGFLLWLLWDRLRVRKRQQTIVYGRI